MILIADDMKNANPGTVAIIQTARLVIVLYTVPLLAALFAHHTGLSEPVGTATASHAAVDAQGGSSWPQYWGYLLLPLILFTAWIACRFHVPAGEFLGPMLLVSALTIAGCSWPSVPDPLLVGAQLSIGIYIGRRVQPLAIIANFRLGPLALITAVFLVSLAAGTAWILSSWTGDSIVTWFLALAPG